MLSDTGGPSLVRWVRGVRWHVRPAFFESPEFDALSRLGSDWRPATGGRRERRRQRWSGIYRAGDSEVFLKYYLPRSSYERFKYLLRPSRASAEWRNAWRLESMGIRVPALLAWGERRSLGGWRQSLLVTEALPDAPTLLEWSKRHPGAEQWRGMSRALAHDVALMHRHGLFHRDLHGRNILVVEDGDSLRPCMVDFHEMLRLRRPVKRFCVDDLARLNGFVEAGRRQRIRFLYDYLDFREIHRSRARDWIVAVDRATRKLWRYYEGKGRDYRRYD